MHKENGANIFSGIRQKIRNHIVLAITAFLIPTVSAVLYAYSRPEQFSANVVLKISRPQSNILEAPLIQTPFFEAFGGSDRFIANEIATLQNISMKEQVAMMLADSLSGSDAGDSKQIYRRIIPVIKEVPDKYMLNRIVKVLDKNVKISQKKGVDFIEITAVSTNPSEAAFIANSYARVYKLFNLTESRKQITSIKEFLLSQKQQARDELMIAENRMKTYKTKGRIVELNEQVKSWIKDLTDCELQRNSLQVKLSSISEKLGKFRNELEKKNPTMLKYLETNAGDATITQLKKEIAKMEVQKEVATIDKSGTQGPYTLKEYDEKLQNLKEKLRTNINEYQSYAYSSSPEDIKEMLKKIMELEIEYESENASLNKMEQIIGEYEERLNKLPRETLELARIEREKMSIEKFYLAVENRYQEALVNEQATPGNVIILSNAKPPFEPSGSNRLLITLAGLFLGLNVSLIVVLIKNYLSPTLSRPGEIEDMGLKLLAWIPVIKNGRAVRGSTSNSKKSESSAKDNAEVTGKSEQEIRSGTLIKESFRTLRTSILTDGDPKQIILVTSAAPEEGKTTVSSNLARSFSENSKKTLLLDFDFRRSRIHKKFRIENINGLADYLCGRITYEKLAVIRYLQNLFIIPTGKMSDEMPDIIERSHISNFLTRIRKEYDVIILDSPPVIAVADTRILAGLVDYVIVVAKSHFTKVEWMQKTIDILEQNCKSNIGIVLNQFNYKTGYLSNYRYFDSYYSKTAITK